MPLYTHPPVPLDGRALFFMRREVAGGDRRLNGVREDGWKYIRTESSADVSEELYDLRRDPRERVDLAATEPAQLAALRERWLAFDREAPRWRAVEVEREVPPR